MRKAKLSVLILTISVILVVHLVSRSALKGSTNKNKLQEDKITHKEEELPTTSSAPQKEHNNVLFIMADDLRAQLGCYQDENYAFSSPPMKTPSFDKLASKSILFKNAFAQYGLCAPSRAVILTGRRPDTNRVFDNFHYWRDVGGDFTTIPQYFKDNGYFTIGIGKTFHPNEASGGNDPLSWTDMAEHIRNNDNQLITPERWNAVTEADEELYPIMDTLLIDVTKKWLRKLAPNALSGKQPFFIAHGFKRPHAPYACPEKFFDKYELETKGEYLTHEESQACVVPDVKLRNYRRAYYACISYIDSLVGELLNELDVLGLGNSTIVSFISDHGYNFGEHGTFGKRILYDTVDRVPLMIRLPGKTDHGIKTSALVETLDMFPTIVDMAGLPPLSTCRNNSDTNPCSEGRSMQTLIADPEQSFKKEVFTQNSLNRRITSMRYSIRTERFRFTKTITIVRDPNGNALSWSDDPDYNQDLYDHRGDPGEHQNRANAARYKDTKVDLNDKLEKHIRSVLLNK